MKKSVVVLVVSFLFTTNIFAQTISTGMICNFVGRKDFNNQSDSVEMFVNGDYLDFETDAGVKFSNNQFQFATSGKYMPQVFTGFQVGGGFTYHLLRYQNIFTEQNFLLSTGARYTTKSLFSIEAFYNLLFVRTSFDYLKDTDSAIKNRNSAIEVNMSQIINDNVSVYWSLASFDYFDYPLLGTPFMKFGVELTPVEKLTLSADYTIKFQDMFTSGVYVSGSYFRTGVRVYLW